MAFKLENKKKFCPHAGSNYRPSVYKTDALPLSYRGHMVLPISHNLNDTTFFLTHYYSSLLFTTTIKFARARELELKIQNKHRNTQFPSLSLSLSLSHSMEDENNTFDPVLSKSLANSNSPIISFPLLFIYL